MSMWNRHQITGHSEQSAPVASPTSTRARAVAASPGRPEILGGGAPAVHAKLGATELQFHLWLYGYTERLT